MALQDIPPSAQAPVTPAREPAPATGRPPVAAPEREAESVARPAAARLTAEARPGRALPGSVERTEAAAAPISEAPRQPRTVEVRIGSITVEIHQAPAPLPAAPVPPAPRRERVAVFSASRHYLRSD